MSGLPVDLEWTGSSKPPFQVGQPCAINYQLVFADPRFDQAPKWLVVNEVTHLAGTDFDTEVTWCLSWRRLTLHGRPDPGHKSIYIVGMDPMPGATAEQLAAYDTFYSTIHIPEVVAAGGYSNGARYQLIQQRRYTRPRAPRFCAVYEADTAATDDKLRSLRAPARARGAARPTYSRGPEAWEGRVTAWRLLYRRITR